MFSRVCTGPLRPVIAPAASRRLQHAKQRHQVRLLVVAVIRWREGWFRWKKGAGRTSPTENKWPIDSPITPTNLTYFPLPLPLMLLCQVDGLTHVHCVFPGNEKNGELRQKRRERVCCVCAGACLLFTLQSIMDAEQMTCLFVYFEKAGPLLRFLAIRHNHFYLFRASLSHI
jgi:hypothetical protein